MVFLLSMNYNYKVFFSVLIVNFDKYNCLCILFFCIITINSVGMF